MKYAPGLPPPVSGVEDRREVQALAAMKAVKPVQPRTLPPLLIQPHGALQEAAAEPAKEKDKRDPTQEPRRQYCRRVSQQPLLEELRSGLERRRQQRRVNDATDHIDEKA